VADAKARAKELLKQRSVLARCPDAVLDDIVRRGQVVRHVRGETIYGQGSPGDSLIILLSGSLKITNVTTDAREVVLGFAKPGALIGEIAVLDGSPRSADVVALEATEAFVIYRRDLMPILRANPDATFALVEGLCSMIRSTNARVESHGMQTQARCAACLVSLAQQHGREVGEEGVVIDLKITQRDLGNYLGLTRETVSRTLSEFKDSGLVETKGNTIVLLDLEALQEIAETEREE
jgi:CRP/FNR family cyclic AMP-dependent transcriptional regulator